jgi:arabinofuranan 3-O-arabinosyltransferase
LSSVEGQAITIEASEPVTASTLELDVVADGRHSLPTQLQLVTDDGDPITLDVPPTERAAPDGVAHVSLPLPREVTSRTWRIELTGIEARTTNDWQTLLPFTLPVGIAEVALPGLPTRPPVADVDTGCRDDLVEIDGEPVSVEVTGDPAAHSTAGGLGLSPCGPGAGRLPAGETTLRTTPSRSTGLAIDRVVLVRTSQAHGMPRLGRASEVTSARHRPGHISGTVKSDGEPFWLVVDESMNDGWELDVDGGRVESGPRPVDSYAAGFYVVPDGPGQLVVTARWAPQRSVDVALAVSGLGALACLALVVGRRRSHAPAPVAASADEPALAPPRAPRLGAALVAAVLAGALVAPEAAAGGAALVLVAWRWPRLGTLLPVALIAASAAAVVVLQVGHEHPATFVWPTRFHWVHPLTAVALIALAVVALAAEPADDPPVSSPP